MIENQNGGGKGSGFEVLAQHVKVIKEQAETELENLEAETEEYGYYRGKADAASEMLRLFNTLKGLLG